MDELPIEKTCINYRTLKLIILPAKRQEIAEEKKNESVTYLMLGQRSFFSYGLYLEAF